MIRQISWDDFSHIENMKDRLRAVEGVMAEGSTLFESNDLNLAKYFLRLATDIPVIDKTFIFAFHGLINNKLVFNDVAEGVLIKFNNGEYTFRLDNGEIKKYPDVSSTKNLTTKTFLFDSQLKYDKFRTIIQMKFNVKLQEMNNIMNESPTADLKNLARAAAKKYSSGQGTDKNPHPGDSYHGKVWQQSFDKAKAKLPEPELITEARRDSVILVDFQPAYSHANGYDEAIAQAMKYINDKQTQVTAYFNGADGGEDDELHDVAWHYVEHGLKEENLDLIKFQEKTYGFFRNWMDTDEEYGQTPADPAITIRVIRYMIMNDIHVSNEIPEDVWLKLVGDNFQYSSEEDRDIWYIYIPQEINIATLKTLSGSIMGGGGKHECLKELQILMNAFNIKYKLVQDWIYG